ncbi:hypothetical protein Tco_0887950 [Tanacetum coccineum]
MALEEHPLGFVEKDFEFEERSTWRRRSGGGRRCSVTSSSLDMLTNNYLGGIMVSLIFLEGLDEEALVEFMILKGVCQNAKIIARPRWDSSQLHRNSEGHSRRKKKKWNDDIFSCHNPFLVFALVEGQEES